MVTWTTNKHQTISELHQNCHDHFRHCRECYPLCLLVLGEQCRHYRQSFSWEPQLKLWGSIYLYCVICRLYSSLHLSVYSRRVQPSQCWLSKPHRKSLSVWLYALSVASCLVLLSSIRTFRIYSEVDLWVCKLWVTASAIIQTWLTGKGPSPHSHRRKATCNENFHLFCLQIFDKNSTENLLSNSQWHSTESTAGMN